MAVDTSTAGSDGYDFAPADALVEFAKANHMELAGHTLVWHSQTPNWVFEGSHPAKQVANEVTGPFSDLTINPPMPPRANPAGPAGPAAPGNQSGPAINQDQRLVGQPLAVDVQVDSEALISVALKHREKNCSNGCVSTFIPWWADTKGK